MKTLLRVLLVIALLLATALVLHRPQPPAEMRGLPWQIELPGDGSSRVFGIHLGVDDVGAVLDRLGRDAELAIIARPGEAGALEIYYPRFQAGPLSGRLIVSAALPAPALEALKRHAPRRKPQESGAVRYWLAHEDLATARAAPVTGLGFIPAAQLDEALALARFGEPDERLAETGEVSHWLYPRLGLDLVMDPDGRELLQYVPPRDFARLRAPLKANPTRR